MKILSQETARTNAHAHNYKSQAHTYRDISKMQMRKNIRFDGATATIALL